MILTGADQIERYQNFLSGRVALAANLTARTQDGTATADVLRSICDLSILLAPEHGIRGTRAAGELFSDGADPVTGLPEVSMYAGDDKRVPKDIWQKVDTVVYDIQDVGCRYYTYISTLKHLIEDCAAQHKRLVVLDRPNPLGNRVQGWGNTPETRSFVGCWDIPVRYGLTCGEFALLYAREAKIDCDLHVLPCRNLTSTMTFRDWHRDWIAPSPNIPNFETALIYPGTCLIEGTNLSEGRGTDAPFFTIGAPFVNGDALTREFMKLHLPGVTAQPIRFTPAASKHAGVNCGGIRLHITEEGKLDPLAVGVHLLCTFKELYPDDLQLTDGEGMPFLSRLAGHREFEKDTWDAARLLAKAEADAAAFRERRQRAALYEGGNEC